MASHACFWAALCGCGVSSQNSLLTRLSFLYPFGKLKKPFQEKSAMYDICHTSLIFLNETGSQRFPFVNFHAFAGKVENN